MGETFLRANRLVLQQALRGESLWAKRFIVWQAKSMKVYPSKTTTSIQSGWGKCPSGLSASYNGKGVNRWSSMTIVLRGESPAVNSHIPSATVSSRNEIMSHLIQCYLYLAGITCCVLPFRKSPS